MKKLNFLSLIFIGLTVLLSVTAVKAQDNPPPTDVQDQNFDEPHRPNLFAELRLSPEQRQQIRRINADTTQQRREAQQNLRLASRNLDQAIYADNVDETDIQSKLKEVQNAQAELTKVRMMTELAIRKLLTPEQLTIFREMRERFMQRMEGRPNQPRNRRRNAPNRPLNDRPPQRQIN